MGQMCDIGAGTCKSTDLIYGIVNYNTNRLHRLTFSRSLAELIVDKLEHHHIEQFSFNVGDKISGEAKGPFTAIVSNIPSHNNLVLRISMIPKIADLMTESNNRYKANVIVKRLGPINQTHKYFFNQMNENKDTHHA